MVMLKMEFVAHLSRNEIILPFSQSIARLLFGKMW